MKKSAFILFFFSLFCVMGSSAQNMDGRYIHAQELNDIDTEVNQIVISLSGTVYSGNWESAMATGENEMVTPLQNVIVDEQSLSITFEKDGQSYSGTFVSDGQGRYALMLNGQTMYSQTGW